MIWAQEGNGMSRFRPMAIEDVRQIIMALWLIGECRTDVLSRAGDQRTIDLVTDIYDNMDIDFAVRAQFEERFGLEWLR